MNKHFLKKNGNGGTRDVHLKWGGHQTFIKNGGVYTSAAENGGDPPSGCFLHLPLQLI